MTLLNKNQAHKNLLRFKSWEISDISIKKKLKFNSYMDSIKFINEIAAKAEELNHHPDMIVGWCEIEISFTSHDKGGITENCIQMAKCVESII
jgi:4a-hydroxytetrahydrobiopterin dehydratase